MPREEEARAHVSQCHSGWTSLFPGATQLCRGHAAEGGLLLGLGAAELGTAVAVRVEGSDSSAARGLPLLAYGDALTLSVMEAALESQRAARLAFVPQETLSELAMAPFSAQVLSQPAVYAGIVGSLAAGLLVSRIVDGPLDTGNFGKRPVLFGRTVSSGAGYPIAGAIGVALFEHVALAEEATFRGLLQSSWSRAAGETRGWIYGSLAFGLIHTTNLFFVDPSQRLGYLAVGVPFITVLGSYLGLAYRWSGYSLAPSVAIHFWYDFLIEAVGFVADPKHSPLAATWSVPF